MKESWLEARVKLAMNLSQQLDGLLNTIKKEIKNPSCDHVINSIKNGKPDIEKLMEQLEKYCEKDGEPVSVPQLCVNDDDIAIKQKSGDTIYYMRTDINSDVRQAAVTCGTEEYEAELIVLKAEDDKLHAFVYDESCSEHFEQKLEYNCEKIRETLKLKYSDESRMEEMYVQWPNEESPIRTKGYPVKFGWWSVYHPERKDWYYVPEKDMTLVKSS